MIAAIGAGRVGFRALFRMAPFVVKRIWGNACAYGQNAAACRNLVCVDRCIQKITAMGQSLMETGDEQAACRSGTRRDPWQDRTQAIVHGIPPVLRSDPAVVGWARHLVGLPGFDGSEPEDLPLSRSMVSIIDLMDLRISCCLW